jgi:uncharacterized membrane protein YdfJ with MMPL/SSD domain
MFCSQVLARTSVWIALVLAPAVMSLLGHHAWWPTHRRTTLDSDRTLEPVPAAR